MPTLEEIRKAFAADRFASEHLGASIVFAEPRHARCSCPILPSHLNAAGTPMGGAIFTLADFAFAVAANGFSEDITVSQNCTIYFLAPAKGTTMTAEAKCLKSGRTTCLYTIDVTDELGTQIAHMTTSGYTIHRKG